MASTHHLHTPAVHRSTFVPPRREAREDRRSARRAAHHRRRVVAVAALFGTAGLLVVSVSGLLLSR